MAVFFFLLLFLLFIIIIIIIIIIIMCITLMLQIYARKFMHGKFSFTSVIGSHATL